MSTTGELSKTVLILAPAANDATVAAEVLQNAGIRAKACADAAALFAGIEGECGAAIISDEALTDQFVRSLHSSLEKQESWSDLPILLLTNADVVRATEMFSTSGNVSLLERPFSQLTLIRSVQAALRSRSKQYEVRDLLQALRHSKEESERANLAKTEFLANMSHEIRTPIGAIMGFIDLLKQGGNDAAESEKYMSIVERNSKQLLRLIDDILDLSKVEAGKMSVEALSFRFGDFLADLASVMNFRAAEKGLHFQIVFETPIPDQITTDPVRLRQILTNVIGNAIKFTEKGSVNLAVAFHSPKLKFRVSDTGVGLSADQAALLFKPFAQADSSTTRRFGGTGLGLILSRRLAEALGGSLVLEHSRPNEGSRFAVEIEPEVSTPTMLDKSPALVLATPRPDHHEALHGMKILLVEDSPDNQFLIENYLGKTGAQITVCSNGEEGAQTAIEKVHDLILMDLQMPVMDGHEATKKLRGLKYTKPIIALTAHAMLEERLRCMASGFDEYLTKPIQRDCLIATLKRYAPGA